MGKRIYFLVIWATIRRNIGEVEESMKSLICILLMLIGCSCDEPATRPASGPTSGLSIRRVHVFISGKVQGVGFRNFTKERADEVGVKGWVKNLLDGRVEAVMQGKAEAVEKVLEGVRKGPRSSRVDGVEVKEEKAGEKYKDFRVIEGQ
jgi:acylphosphatase